MSDIHAAFHSHPSVAIAAQFGGLIDRVMSVLLEIRPLQSNGLCYDENSNLSDAGFTSVEMVKVMLGVEAAFDLMIPQDMITPEHFASADSSRRGSARHRRLRGLPANPDIFRRARDLPHLAQR